MAQYSSKIFFNFLVEIKKFSACVSPQTVAGAGVGLLSQVEIPEKDRVRNSNFIFGGGISQLGPGVVGGVTSGATQVNCQVLDAAEVEKQIPLQQDRLRDYRETQPGRREMLQVEFRI